MLADFIVTHDYPGTEYDSTITAEKSVEAQITVAPDPKDGYALTGITWF